MQKRYHYQASSIACIWCRASQTSLRFLPLNMTTVVSILNNFRDIFLLKCGVLWRGVLRIFFVFFGGGGDGQCLGCPDFNLSNSRSGIYLHRSARPEGNPEGKANLDPHELVLEVFHSFSLCLFPLAPMLLPGARL